jgi:hypothetical protein
MQIRNLKNGKTEAAYNALLEVIHGNGSLNNKVPVTYCVSRFNIIDYRHLNVASSTLQNF